MIEGKTLVLAKKHTNSFFINLLKLVVPSYFRKMLLLLLNAAEAARHMHEIMAIAGFPGCLGSTDATHILIEKCIHKLRNQHMSKKLPGTACTYNITVNHHWQILSTTTGHPCCWNNKTLILFDTFARGIYRCDDHLRNVEFELLERDNNGNVVTIKFRLLPYSWQWVLVLVDNSPTNKMPNNTEGPKVVRVAWIST